MYSDQPFVRNVEFYERPTTSLFYSISWNDYLERVSKKGIPPLAHCALLRKLL
jgi:hypothetical protein